MRALNDKGILGQVKVMSTVSGGSVIGAAWAYSNDDFTVFDRRMIAVLRRGLTRDILGEAFFGPEALRILASLAVAIPAFLILSPMSVLVRLLGFIPGIPVASLHRVLIRIGDTLPIWGNLTTAFQQALIRRVFGPTTLEQVLRPHLDVIIGAADLRTGTAFRFGSARSGGWRYGTVSGEPILVAKAVAASAAFPLLLPPIVERFAFQTGSQKTEDTVVLTDGGVYENLGVAVLEPGRADDAIFRYPVTHIISLNAGPGQFEIGRASYGFAGRIMRSFDAVYRKAQDAAYQRLHAHVAHGDLAGFGMVYLGQQDARLPWRQPDFIGRDLVRDYPTNFSPMRDADIELLTKRGEQLTHIIVERYLKDLCR
jgi:NTE family protein